jgi:conjugal transfer pilus assembly protein TraU
MLTLVVIALESTAQTQLGKTYEITESDALVEINDKAKAFKGIKGIDIKQTTAFKGYPLPKVSEPKERLVSPFYTLEFDVTDKAGRVIYPRGFTYNVAEYVQLPFRVVVFSEDQLEFIIPMLKPSDILLLSEGDILEVKKKLDANLFYLDGRLAERLYVENVPSIVSQVGVQYRIHELGGAHE